MDLGIAGRRAIVCGASAGLGRGCALALAREGVDLVLNARRAEPLEATAAELRALTGAKITAVAADVTTEEGRHAVLAAYPDPDILINNAGGPPLGDFRQFNREDWIKALDSNMLSAIFMMQATIDPMIARGWGRIVNITSHMVKAPANILTLSNGARAGLTGFVGGLSREVAKHGVIINNLLPGQFDTDRLRYNHERIAQASKSDLETVRANARRAIPAGRLGDPDEFGAVAAFLCSNHVAFFTGQNVMLDGGQFPGLM
jgi:3-oxoacyl-[acyl-carrier protein] reductase